MNNRAQVMFFLLMVGIVIIILALALAPVVQDTITDMRDNETAYVGLDCTNSSISQYDKATCVIADLTIFHFIVGLILLGGAVIAARKFI